jgi:PIN domain nuclease of toxin-antitoxin system
MRVLLDTHAFLWWLIEPARLSPHALDVISDTRNQLIFSVASGWEIAIKTRLGKLDLPDRPDRLIPQQLALDGIETLPIQLAHALHTFSLPDHHGDPFDRLLVAQAQLEKLPIVTADPLIARYDVTLLW